MWKYNSDNKVQVLLLCGAVIVMLNMALRKTL